MNPEIFRKCTFLLYNSKSFKMPFNTYHVCPSLKVNNQNMLQVFASAARLSFPQNRKRVHRSKLSETGGKSFFLIFCIAVKAEQHKQKVTSMIAWDHYIKWDDKNEIKQPS